MTRTISEIAANCSTTNLDQVRPETGEALIDTSLDRSSRPEHRVRLTVMNFIPSTQGVSRSMREVLFGGSSGNPDDQAHLLTPLYQVGGILFPYTPSVVFQSQTSYSFYEPMHSIHDFAAYQRSTPPEFQIVAPMTVQTIDEGRYALACIHFLRVVTKMYFGRDTRNAGTPPPVLMLSGYGRFMMDRIPCVVTGYNLDLPNDVDYVEVPVTDNNAGLVFKQPANELQPTSNASNQPSNGVQDINNRFGFVSGGSETTGSAWLPSMFNLSVSVRPTRTPQQARQFDLDAFRRGEMLGSTQEFVNGGPVTGGGWW